MRSRLPVLLCLIGALAGCEWSDISNFGRREATDANTLVTLQETGGAVIMEIHGAPWEGATPDEIAGTLRMPEGPGRQVRFRAVPPGQGLIGNGTRIVLHFNPKRKPDSGRDCSATSEIATGAPDGDGFIVHASFCRGESWLVKATFDASDVNKDDWLAYYLRMQELLGAMFPNP